MADLYYVKGSCGNNLEFIDELLKNMVDVIVTHGSNNFWKLLKYPTSNAPFEQDVTIEQRLELIDQGSIRRMAYNNDISTSAHNELRIFPYRWEGEKRDNYNVTIGFDVICHNSIIELKNGKTASMTMVHEMLDLFNDALVNKNIGTFTISGLNGGITYYNSEYQGYRFYIRGNSC